MIIYPAVDIRDGRCVRLRKGEPDAATDYGRPAEVAARYQREGAAWLHVVDLDGAFGTGDNSEIIAAIVHETGLPVQVGGGIRSREQIRRYLDRGVSRVILGTAAVENPELVRWAVDNYGGRIAAGLDARRGRLALHGWTAQSDVDALEMARHLSGEGVSVIIYTDIARDGMMSGPDTDMTARLAAEVRANIVGSGGISSLGDVEAMREAGAGGLIIGRALLDGAFSLAEAVRCAEPC
ncbi:MAG: 1-(5-phosphoribosyl)-5-[(5-phosphoribosylamino)methylideneamino]imidazole-4-carboxamide isomerase [Clostridia bacterium]|nr:1-(5-phosphoribosyl)-5-[(5-phosphoribosylamino)methylideneamino]imidazole-4-carboxamide isomerase [Clostridia bacterium]